MKLVPADVWKFLSLTNGEQSLFVFNIKITLPIKRPVSSYRSELSCWKCFFHRLFSPFTICLCRNAALFAPKEHLPRVWGSKANQADASSISLYTIRTKYIICQHFPKQPIIQQLIQVFPQLEKQWTSQSFVGRIKNKMDALGTGSPNLTYSNNCYIDILLQSS